MPVHQIHSVSPGRRCWTRSWGLKGVNIAHRFCVTSDCCRNTSLGMLWMFWPQFWTHHATLQNIESSVGSRHVCVGGWWAVGTFASNGSDPSHDCQLTAAVVISDKELNQAHVLYIAIYVYNIKYIRFDSDVGVNVCPLAFSCFKLASHLSFQGTRWVGWHFPSRAPIELNLDSFLRICLHESTDLKVYNFDGEGTGYVNVEQRYVRAWVTSFSHAAWSWVSSSTLKRVTSDQRRSLEDVWRCPGPSAGKLFFFVLFCFARFLSKVQVSLRLAGMATPRMQQP